MHIITWELAAIWLPGNFPQIKNGYKHLDLGHQQKNGTSHLGMNIFILNEQIRGIPFCSWAECVYSTYSDTDSVTDTENNSSNNNHKQWTLNIYKIIITSSVGNGRNEIEKMLKAKFSTLQNSIMWGKRRNKNCTNENKRGRIYLLWPHHFLALHRTGFYEVYILFYLSGRNVNLPFCSADFLLCVNAKRTRPAVSGSRL